MRSRTADAALYRELPSTDELLRSPALAALLQQHGHAPVARAVRGVLDDLRAGIARGALDAVSLPGRLQRLEAEIAARIDDANRPSLRPVVNATGVVLHTNLGRAPLALQALDRIRETAGVYSNLEFDLATGERGRRDAHAQHVLDRLFEDTGTHTIVVNNCAAAALLALSTLARGGEAIVSRGELVEIGGSFRVPDVLEQSGAVLREVGTTNRTRLADYERALNERTRLILRVHRSNFAIVGFTEQPALADLCALGRAHGVPVMEDLGNGALIDLQDLGIRGEGGVRQSLVAGVDLVAYSGDKLLGGPQAGLLTGRPDLVDRMRRHPLFRALRAGKLTYAALEGTLLAYEQGRDDSIPAVHLLRQSPDALRARAERLREALPPDLRERCEIVPGRSLVGGGTAPTATLPTHLLALSCAGADGLLEALRQRPTPVVARIEDGRVVLDLRTVFPAQDGTLLEALRSVLRSTPAA